MKLTKRHLFLFLLLTVVFCCGLGVFDVREGMESKDNSDPTSQTTDKEKTNSCSSRNSNGNEYSGYAPVQGADGLVRVISTDDGRVIHATPQNTVNGIPGRSIPPGQEDLYILKSEIVPPVCPACPTIINTCDSKKDCPACPPCGRCPEPSFECVKRPTYKSDNPYLPVPVLSDFSSFGM